MDIRAPSSCCIHSVHSFVHKSREYNSKFKLINKYKFFSGVLFRITHIYLTVRTNYVTHFTNRNCLGQFRGLFCGIHEIDRGCLDMLNLRTFDRHMDPYWQAMTLEKQVCLVFVVAIVIIVVVVVSKIRFACMRTMYMGANCFFVCFFLIFGTWYNRDAIPSVHLN